MANEGREMRLTDRQTIDILHVEIVIVAVLAVGFVIAYWRSPWRSSRTGVALMTYSSAIALVVGVSALKILGWWSPRPWVYLVLYLYLIFAFARHLFNLLRIQWSARRLPKNRPLQ